MPIYGEELAYIHEAGFSWFARESATGILALLRRYGVDTGSVVDLGCGNGIWVRQLSFAGYTPIGIDVSEEMIRRARKTVPGATFLCADVRTAAIPPCDAVTAMGEVLSYAAAGNRLFRRVYRALRKGGVFVFDVAVGGRRPGGMKKKDFWQGDDWAALVEAVEADGILTRKLTAFRQHGAAWRRSVEVHRLTLYDPSVLAEQLRHAGFEVRRLRGYGDVRFHSGHAGFVAQKP
jgi:SAM-dependent methyltransferase